MGCDEHRELISAGLDGEVDDVERAVLAAHIESCAACAAFAAALDGLHRSSRVAPAPAVPDLTDAILVRAAADPTIDVVAPPEHEQAPVAVPPVPTGRGRRARPGVAVLAFQYGLLVVALLMAVMAVPDLFAASGDAVHTSRHLGGWDVAFAIGLLLAALQPWRARGLLPMAAALAGVMVVTAAVDIARGATPGMAEGTHLLEVLGLLFLWLLSRSFPVGERPGRERPSETPSAASLAPARRLRSLPSRFGRAPAPVILSAAARGAATEEHVRRAA